MFDAFSTPVQTRAITLDAVQKTTGLEWVPIDFDDPKIPAEQGVYVWVESAPPHALWYHGSGSGNGGLRQRLAAQLRWRANQSARLSVDLDSLSEQDSYDLAREVPAVQQAAKGRLLHYAIAGPAPWSVERNEIEPPQNALEWESFISAVSLLTVGHRSIVGGGAWESKTGTIGHLMTDLAWDRLCDVLGVSWE